MFRASSPVICILAWAKDTEYATEEVNDERYEDECADNRRKREGKQAEHPYDDEPRYVVADDLKCCAEDAAEDSGTEIEEHITPLRFPRPLSPAKLLPPRVRIPRE